MRKHIWSRHGLSNSRVYKIWCKMKERCSNPKDISYVYYGARGISVCPEWRDSFPTFFADMGHPPTNRHSIDRIDTSKSYCRENCKWSTPAEQCNNKRSNVILSCNGISKNMTEWSKEIGISVGTIWRRISLGWNDNDVVLVPLRKKQTTPPATL